MKKVFKQSTGIISFRKWSKESQIINKILRSTRRGYPYIQSTMRSFIRRIFNLFSPKTLCSDLYISLNIFKKFLSQYLLLDIRMAPLAASQVICFHQWFLEFFDFLFWTQKSKEMRFELSEEKSFLWKMSSNVKYHKVSNRWIVKWPNLNITLLLWEIWLQKFSTLNATVQSSWLEVLDWARLGDTQELSNSTFTW